jgi:hypothetical protein
MCSPGWRRRGPQPKRRREIYELKRGAPGNYPGLGEWGRTLNPSTEAPVQTLTAGCTYIHPGPNCWMCVQPASCRQRSMLDMYGDPGELPRASAPKRGSHFPESRNREVQRSRAAYSAAAVGCNGSSSGDRPQGLHFSRRCSPDKSADDSTSSADGTPGWPSPSQDAT